MDLQLIFNDFKNLFLKMDYFTLSFFLLGIILLCLEIFIPLRREFFLFGLMFYIIASISRILQGGTLLMFYYLVFILCFIFSVLYFAVIHKDKKYWLEKSSMLSVNCYFIGNRSTYNFLLGMHGKANTVLDPEGFININGYNFLARSKDDEVIDEGVAIFVVDVDGNSIYVSQNSIKS